MSVVSPVRPVGVLDRRMTLRELVDQPSLTDLCMSFVELHRLGVKVFDEDGARLVDIKTGSGDFCAYLFTKSPGKQRCTETVTYLKQHPLPVVGNERGCEARTCFSGTRYVMAPIVHEGDLLGRVVLGPFVPEEAGDLSPELFELAGAFDLERVRELQKRIRRASETAVRRIAEHFGKVLEVLLFASYRAALTSQMHIEAISEDYRELQAKSRELKESYERLQELDRLKSNFLATVSHELRTPLTSIIGYSEMLLAGLAGELNPEQEDYLSTVLEKGEGLLNLITSLLDLSKVESQGVKLALKETAVPAIVRQSVSTVLPLATKRRIELSTEVDESMPPAVVDPDKLRQAIVNLLSNAVKFTPDGGKILVRSGLLPQAPEGTGPFGRASRFLVSVQDNGIGIAPAEQERIFETFYQVDSSSTRAHGGAGLGLSLVKSYVEAHGGKVWVQSRLDEGSTFTLDLPLETAQPARP